MSTQTRLSTLVINMVAALVIATPSAVYPSLAANQDHKTEIVQLGKQDQMLRPGENLLAISTQITTLGNSVQAVLASAVQVEVGVYHTCALLSSGALKCWGLNMYGQLGNNSTTNALVPVDVVGLGAGVSAITAGYGHTCALLSTGAVKCWGLNTAGELGNNSTTEAHVPVGVVGLEAGVSAITAGQEHTCALLSSGALKCWGSNWGGQLGNNSRTNASVPMDVFGLGAGASAITAGHGHTCALLSSGALKCWGSGGYGQLGNNSTTEARVPVDVFGLGAGVSAIDAGAYHTCALLSSGALKCWGRNQDGQLGNNSTTEARVPVDVFGLGAGVSAISAGDEHTCALLSSGALKCWGRNQDGQLGNNSTTEARVPVDVFGLGAGVTAISSSRHHTCALLSSDALKCWGRNEYGQLGNNSTTDARVPVDVVGFGGGNSATATPTSIAISPGDVCGYISQENGLGYIWWIFHNELNGEKYLEGRCEGNPQCFAPPLGVRRIWTADRVTLKNISPPVTSPSGISLNKSIYFDWSDYPTHPLPPVVSQCNNIPATSTPYPTSTPIPTARPTATSTPAPQLFDGAELHSQSDYLTVSPGQQIQPWVKIRNSGTTTWRAGQYGYKTEDQWANYFGSNGKLWRDVPPGDIIEFKTNMTSAPQAPGTYRYGLTLTRPDGSTFGYYFYTQVTVVQAATATPIPATSTPIPPSATSTSTATRIPPTATPTSTSTPRPPITGYVRSNDGVPLPGIKVVAGYDYQRESDDPFKHQNEPQQIAMAYTNAAGEFRLENPWNETGSFGNGFVRKGFIQIEQEPKDCGLTFPTKWIWDKNASKFDFKATVNMGTPRNKTIVFVQGWQGFDTNWGIVSSFNGADKLMRESGYNVFCPPLLTSAVNTPRIAINTDILSDYMRKISLWTGHSSDITLIAHSMGGIVARDYVERVMNKTNQLLVSRLFMFGSPHKGVINDLSFLDLDLSENPTGFQMILADTSLLQKVYIDFNPASMDDFNCNGNRARPSNVTYYYIGGSKSNFLLPNILESRLRGFILGKLSYSYGGSSIASRCANANINSGPDSTELLNQFDGVVGLRSSLRENQGEGYRLDYPSGIFVNHLNYFGNDMTQKSYADCLIPVLVKRNGDCGLKYSWQELGKYKTTDTISYDNPPSSISLIQKNELIDTQTITQIIRIEGGNPTFAVKSPITPSIVMKLIDPTGKTIDFSARSNVTEGNITYEKSTGLVAYKVQNALPGNWQISMRLANPVSTKLNAISFALLDTPAVLTVSLDRSVYPLNSKMVLSAKLANASFQSASVNAYINRGDGKVDVVPMTFDGKKFVAEYVIPPTIHYGFVEFEASGILQDGKAFERSSSIDFAAPGSSSYFPAVTNSLVNSETPSPCGSSDCYGLNSDYDHANAR